ncbi:Uncharacterised protein [Candidatus Gugararchaeum adminiculabundum]|nr:Uncharacterised protein [Candidatus Gugararchaeum adminiculabundum]
MKSRRGAVDEIIGLVAAVVGLVFVLTFIFSNILIVEQGQASAAKQAQAVTIASDSMGALLSYRETASGKTVAELLSDAQFLGTANLDYGFGARVDVNSTVALILEKTYDEKDYAFALGNGSFVSCGKLPENATNVIAYSMELPTAKIGESANVTLKVRG